MSKLKIIYQNVHGLRTKQEIIYESMIGLDADVVALIEFWLGDSHLHADFFLLPITFIDLIVCVRLLSHVEVDQS